MSRHQIGELQFNTELKKQERIERSLVELIHVTNGNIKRLKFQLNIEAAVLGGLLYMGGCSLFKNFTHDTIEESKEEFGFWGKALCCCTFMSIFCFHVQNEHTLQEQKKIHDDCIRDLPIVRQRIANLRAEAKSHSQPTNNSENGMTLNMR